MWTSGSNFACNLDRLKENGIGAVVTAADLKYEFPPEIKQIKLIFEDKPNEPLLPQVSKAVEFIEEQRKHTGVVIHCVSGISRGPAVTIGYLIKAKNMSFEDALEAVKGKRGCTDPNPGFVEQLK